MCGGVSGEEYADGVGVSGWADSETVDYVEGVGGVEDEDGGYLFPFSHSAVFLFAGY